ncbi:MAG TPA: ribosome assembly RNA-binding protein YhbY [Polyangiaceae bacterium]
MTTRSSATSTPPPLTGKQRRHLRALAHPLKPVVQVGHAGLTAPVLSAIDGALETHELIKVRVAGEAPETDEIARRIEARTNSVVAQIIGKTLIVYRRRKKDPTISLPKASKAAQGD